MKRKKISIVTALVMLSCVSASILPFHGGIEKIYGQETQQQGHYKYSILNDGTVEIVEYTGEEDIVKIPSEIGGRKVTSIGYNAFISVICKSIEIPRSVTNIEKHAFFCCKASEIKVPDSVEYIGESAFMGVNNLTSIRIPDGVKSIENSTFDSCGKLKQVKIPDSVTEIGEFAFERCESLTDIKIPDGVRRIGAQAFGNCKNLKKVTIGKNMTSIKQSAFVSCGKLKSIVIKSTNLKTIGKYAFAKISPKAVIKVPKNKLSTYKKLFKGQQLGKNVKITAS